jgi:hypothetical protein
MVACGKLFVKPRYLNTGVLSSRWTLRDKSDDLYKSMRGAQKTQGGSYNIDLSFRYGTIVRGVQHRN